MPSTDDLHSSIVLDRELTVVHSAAGSNFSDGPGAPSWPVRRAFVRARRGLLHMRLRDVSRYLLQINNLLSASDSGLRERYEGALAELRVCALVAQDDLPRARELLRVMSPVGSARTLLATLRRYIDWTHGIGLEPSAWRPPDPAPRGHRPVLEQILTLCLNAALEFEHLRPTIAANFAAEALRLTIQRYGADSPVSCLPAVLLSQIAYEQGRLSEADSLLRPRVTLIRTSGTLECVLRAFTVLARLSLHQGRSREALASLRDAEAIGRTRGWARLVSAARAEHARILLVATHTATTDMHSAHRAGASSAIGGGEIGETRTLSSYSSIQSLLARVSNTSFLQGADPCRILLSCLRIGAARGLYRLFIDAGTPIVRLLQTLHDDPERLGAHAKDLHGYIGLLLRTAAPTSAHIETSPRRRHAPLSRREKVILGMIAHGMCNKRIAQSLGIAPETVKSHAKSIFLKLGTRTRAQAVAHVASMHLS
jgi:DNA-binding CsgD family transcriptional regulator